ncbi:DoxX family protein [Georgenia alba]|uniref:DoxX family protein n=1 Tax=Georgenia alba TaxID=2233858 RepID=A0ABW2QCW6_9MICO
MTALRLLARPMLAAPFVADGVDALLHPKDHVEKVRNVQPVLEKAGVPPALLADPTLIVRASGAVTALSGLLLATGRNPRTAALTLAAITLPATLAKNPVWQATTPQERSGHVAGLLKGVGLCGGALLAAADLAGMPSWSWRVANARDNRARLRATKARLKARYKD